MTTELFDRLFMQNGVGSPTMECSCGRIHYSDSRDYDPGEFDELRARAEKQPRRYVYNQGDDGVSARDILGVTFVLGCECKWDERAERMLWSYRKEIARYIGERIRERIASDKQTLRALESFDDPTGES